ncbi:polysaccharide deacetylase family protein [Arthrobacter sp. AZCC_0090]|uniref:polysaccharide deacetylase family protein n=1 Tax=Arthrobacter sp. AZCC_0090 TaxID=2735881 RepID=UPI001608F0AC|nr:polysaccharide deacetylase family protein [Arthrobacter sp. AZCC_0090]MBB6403195.1 peptidoglycan/xylan/chitin deacetylase (PgdA/CDA1 family) [Arthrobacter sp. AZCC_0090]
MRWLQKYHKKQGLRTGESRRLNNPNKNKQLMSIMGVLLLTAGTLGGIAVPAHAAAPTIVSLTFDDGNDNQLAAEQVLKAHGLVGTFFITTSWIGTPSYLTQANLQTIAGDGNEIGGHTVTHPDLTTLTAAAASAEICNGKSTLESWGFQVSNFAYPFAAENATVQTEVKNCGFASGRGLGDIRSPASCPSCPFAETLPPANPLVTKAPDEVDSTWTLQNLQDLVTNAESTGGWLQLTFHHIAIGTDPTLTISPTLFDTFVTWLAARTANGTTSVKTVAQALGQSTPPPPPPPPPASSPFIDVPVGYPFFTEINWMAAQGISTGWDEGNGTKTYRPLQAANRDAMAAFMYRLAGSPAFIPPAVSPFSDTTPQTAFYKEISWLAAQGISTGWDEGNGTRTYRPLQAVNRDATAAFLYRFAHSPAFTAPAVSPFADVSPQAPFYKEITWLSSTGISKGWTETNGTRTFRPGTPVNRDAVAAFMYRYDTSFPRN